MEARKRDGAVRERESDGWLFKDAAGNMVNIGGDAKAIRVRDRRSADWDKYREYHAEHETQTYEQKFGQAAQKAQ